jgi:phage gpG-like protein
MIRLELNDRELKRALDKLATRLGDMGPALDRIGQQLVEGTRTGIESGKDWTGRAFASNSPTTLLKKRGNKPLIDSGIFKDVRLSHHLQGGNTVLVSAGGVQAATLQFGARRGQFGQTRRGAPIPWGDIPARPFFPDDKAAQGPALAMLADYIKDVLADLA